MSKHRRRAIRSASPDVCLSHTCLLKSNYRMDSGLLLRLAYAAARALPLWVRFKINDSLSGLQVYAYVPMGWHQVTAAVGTLVSSPGGSPIRLEGTGKMGRNDGILLVDGDDGEIGCGGPTARKMARSMFGWTSSATASDDRTGRPGRVDPTDPTQMTLAACSVVPQPVNLSYQTSYCRGDSSCSSRPHRAKQHRQTASRCECARLDPGHGVYALLPCLSLSRVVRPRPQDEPGHGLFRSTLASPRPMFRHGMIGSASGIAIRWLGLESWAREVGPEGL